MTMPASTVFRPCPLCRKSTPARTHLPPGAYVARHDPAFCPECWPARRDEIARLLDFVIAAQRARVVSIGRRAVPPERSIR
jgi:hypothetical protein